MNCESPDPYWYNSELSRGKAICNFDFVSLPIEVACKIEKYRVELSAKCGRNVHVEELIHLAILEFADGWAKVPMPTNGMSDEDRKIREIFCGMME